MYQSGLSDALIIQMEELAQKYGITKIILFGSRARGDFSRASDIDIAVCGGNVERFAVDAEEELPTLLTFDVVDLSKDISESLRESIQREGVILYEKI